MNVLIRKQSGFTLIEVLIAITLLAFISLYTYKMIDTNLDTKEKVLKEDQLLIQTLTAIGRIDSDVSQIYSPLYSYSRETPNADSSLAYQENTTAKGLFDGKTKNAMIVPLFQSEDKSSLLFLTASNRRKIADAKESRYTWVKYSMRRTDTSHQEKDESNLNTLGENELIRQTIATNLYSPDLNWSDVKAQVLLTQIKSIEYSFWDEKAKKFTTSIQDLNENKNSIRSLKLNLVWVDEDNHEQKIEKIFRILYPYFTPKVDDLKTSGAYGGGAVPPGLPTPPTENGGANEIYN
ncbi:MAG: prepilin-type N-terminal cleavage/methylation domain-containing protein [Bacteriovorax sp.]|nr:prepilin-type N-terminal cleavage/methylation domain-containing protein [Bacteriovorax sp.]